MAPESYHDYARITGDAADTTEAVVDDFEDGDKITKATDWDGWKGDTGSLTVTGGEGILTANNSSPTIETQYTNPETVSTASVVVDGDTQAGSGSYGFEVTAPSPAAELNFLLVELNQDGLINVANGYDRQKQIGTWSVDTEYEFRIQNADYVNWDYYLTVLEAGSEIHSGTEEFRAAVDQGDTVALKIFEDSGTTVEYDTQVVRGTIDAGLSTGYIPPGSIDWYRANKGSGDIVKNWRRASAGGRFGNINGPTWVSGNYVGGYALDGDGTDDYVALHELGDFGSNIGNGWAIAFTVETTADKNQFFGVFDTVEFQIGMNRYEANAGQLRFRIGDTNGDTTNFVGDTINDGNKHRVVVVGDANTFTDSRLYVDNVENTRVNRDQGSSSWSNFSNDLFWFAQNDGTGSPRQPVDATMDNLVISQEEWSASQVDTDYNEQPWT